MACREREGAAIEDESYPLAGPYAPPGCGPFSFATHRPNFVGSDAFFVGRAVQLSTLAAHNRIPAAYSLRVHVAAGGLMSYGTDIGDAFRQVGFYTGSVLKGAKPADLPVRQSTQFEFVLNLQPVRIHGIEVPAGILHRG